MKRIKNKYLRVIVKNVLIICIIFIAPYIFFRLRNISGDELYMRMIIVTGTALLSTYVTLPLYQKVQKIKKDKIQKSKEVSSNSISL
jgi:hypothetical protein